MNIGQLWKTKPQLRFFLQKSFLVSRICSHDSKFNYRNNERDDKQKLIKI